MKGFRDSSIRKFIDDFLNINREMPLVMDVVKHVDRDVIKAFCLDLLSDFQRELVFKNSFGDTEVEYEVPEENELIDIM